MLKCVLGCITSRAVRGRVSIQGMHHFLERLVLSGADLCQKNLISAGGQPLLLLRGFSGIGLVRTGMGEGRVNNHGIYVSADGVVGDRAAISLQGGCLFCCYVCKLIAGHI